MVVVDAATRAAIEAETGVRTADIPAEQLAFVASGAKAAGNAAFKERRYTDAVKLYCTAIAADERDAALFANRSATYLALDRAQDALVDAAKAVELDRQWPKGYYRMGCALAAMERWGAASQALDEGLKLAPDSKDMQLKARQAKQKAEELASAKRVELAATRRELVLKLRDARREDRIAFMEWQFSQGLSSPEHEPEDYEWRPTFMPSMKLRPPPPGALGRMERKMKGLRNYVAVLGELDQPKAALRLAQDATRLGAFERALSGAVARMRATGNAAPHVLVMEEGTGLLPLMAALCLGQAGGGGRVTAVCRSRTLLRMAKQCVNSNAALLARVAPGVALSFAPANVTHLSAEGMPAPTEAHRERLCVLGDDRRARSQGQEQGGGSSEEQAEGSHLPSAADMLLMDTFGFELLGQRALPVLDFARRYQLAPGAEILPRRVVVRARLLELRITDVCGVDVSFINSYRWYPGHERVADLEATNYRFLSEPFEAAVIELNGRAPSELGMADWELDETLLVDVAVDGVSSGVLWWYELDLGSGAEEVAAAHDAADDAAESGAVGGSVVLSSGPEGGADIGQAIMYWDEIPVKLGEQVAVRVRQSEHQLQFSSAPPATRPRHAHIPRWHFDMLMYVP